MKKRHFLSHLESETGEVKSQSITIFFLLFILKQVSIDVNETKIFNRIYFNINIALSMFLGYKKQLMYYLYFNNFIFQFFSLFFQLTTYR